MSIVYPAPWRQYDAKAKSKFKPFVIMWEWEHSILIWRGRYYEVAKMLPPVFTKGLTRSANNYAIICL